MKRVGLLCDSWNANCVRLCVHSKFWFGQEWYQGKSYGDYRKMVDNVINQITSRGKYVILNLHEFYAITEQQKDFWNDAVEVYGNNPGVIFGLLNEPHDIGVTAVCLKLPIAMERKHSVYMAIKKFWI